VPAAGIPSRGPGCGDDLHLNLPHMRTSILVLFLGLFVSGCFGTRGPTAGERKAQCDRLAAQAIDTESLDEARRLAARASDCYAELQAQRR
jgi:hypothetical protein